MNPYSVPKCAKKVSNALQQTRCQNKALSSQLKQLQWELKQAHDQAQKFRFEATHYRQEIERARSKCKHKTNEFAEVQRPLGCLPFQQNDAANAKSCISYQGSESLDRLQCELNRLQCQLKRVQCESQAAQSQAQKFRSEAAQYRQEMERAQCDATRFKQELSEVQRILGCLPCEQNDAVNAKPSICCEGTEAMDEKFKQFKAFQNGLRYSLQTAKEVTQSLK